MSSWPFQAWNWPIYDLLLRAPSAWFPLIWFICAIFFHLLLKLFQSKTNFQLGNQSGCFLFHLNANLWATPTAPSICIRIRMERKSQSSALKSFRTSFLQSLCPQIYFISCYFGRSFLCILSAYHAINFYINAYQPTPDSLSYPWLLIHMLLLFHSVFVYSHVCLRYTQRKGCTK